MSGKHSRRAAAPYQGAMSTAPRARDKEFELPLDYAEIKSGQRLFDYPSGGAYFRHYLPDDVHYIPAEYASGYSDVDMIFCEGDKIPLADNCIDVSINLAALHHSNTGQRLALYEEIFRLTKYSGCFVISDVAKDSKPANWLDEFVNTYSEEGHRANFLTADEEKQHLLDAGFEMAESKHEHYPWVFDSKQQTVDFCRGLFRLNLATDEQIWQGIHDYLGLTVLDSGIHEVHWSLLMIKATKLNGT